MEGYLCTSSLLVVVPNYNFLRVFCEDEGNVQISIVLLKHLDKSHRLCLDYLLLQHLAGGVILDYLKPSLSANSKVLLAVRQAYRVDLRGFVVRLEIPSVDVALRPCDLNLGACFHIKSA